MSILMYFDDEDCCDTAIPPTFDADYHRHRCRICGTTWSHIPNNIQRNSKAHTCPECGSENYGPEFDVNGKLIINNDTQYPDYNGVT